MNPCYFTLFSIGHHKICLVIPNTCMHKCTFTDITGQGSRHEKDYRKADSPGMYGRDARWHGMWHLYVCMYMSTCILWVSNSQRVCGAHACWHSTLKRHAHVYVCSVITLNSALAIVTGCIFILICINQMILARIRAIHITELPQFFLTLCIVYKMYKHNLSA